MIEMPLYLFFVPLFYYTPLSYCIVGIYLQKITSMCYLFFIMGILSGVRKNYTRGFLVMKVVNDMTAANLRSAHGGESMAHMRYKVWGAKAKEDGFENVARLFKAIAYAEEVHAANHFRELREIPGDFLVASMAGFGLDSTSENLQGAIDGENFEIEQMYPAYIAVAKEQKEAGGLRSFHYAVEAEKIHAVMFSKAKEAVDNNKDLDLGDVQICSVCGYTVEGDAPERCPICGEPHSQFVAFTK